MSYLSHSGAKVPGNESSRERKYPRERNTRERKFQGAKVPCNFRSRERKFQGAKVPPMVLSLLGAKVRGNESSSYPALRISRKQLEMLFRNDRYMTEADTVGCLSDSLASCFNNHSNF